MGFISNCPAFDEYSGLCLGITGNNTTECKHVVLEQYCDCLFDTYCSEHKGVVVTNPEGKDYVNNERLTMPECIERKAALDQAVFVHGRFDERYISESKLLTIPAADVRPVKKGQWVSVTNGRGGHECDQCHNYAASYQSGAEYLSKWCPNCGADMRSKQKEDEN